MERNNFIDKIYHDVVERDLNNLNCKFPLRVFRGRPKCNLCNERRHLLYTSDDYRCCIYCNINIMAFRIQRAFRNYIQNKNLKKLDFLDNILIANYQREINNGIKIDPTYSIKCDCCNEYKNILDRHYCCFGCKLNIMAFRIQRMYRSIIQRRRLLETRYVRDIENKFDIDIEIDMKNMELVK